MLESLLVSFEYELKLSREVGFLVLRILLSFAILILSLGASAASPTSFVYQGQITKSNGEPLEANPVIFTVRVYSPTNDCLLYEEQHSANMLGSEGTFSLNIGNGIRTGSDYEDTSSLAHVFANGVSFTGITNCSSGNSYTALTGHTRKIRVSYDAGAGMVTLAQDFHLQSVPYAWYANSLQGFTASQFVQVNPGQNITQSSLENLLGGSNYNTLYNFASGTSTAPISMNNQQIKNLANPTLPQDAATKNYTDTRVAGSLVNLSGVGAGMGDGRVLAWNATLNQWEAMTPSAITDSTKLPLSGGTMSGHINMNGNQVLNTGHITMQSLSTVTLGKFTDAEETTLAGTLTVANRGAMWFNSTDGALRYWDGAAVVDVQGGGGTITAVTAGVGLVGGGNSGALSIDIATGGITSTLLANDSVTTAKILDGTILTADIADGAITNVKITSLNVSKIVNGPGDYFSYMPAGSACSDGDVLKWDNTNNRWICGADVSGAGDITSVNTSGPIAGGSASGAVNLSFNYDTNTLNVNGSNQLEVKAGGISAAQLAAGAVTDAKIDTVSVNKITSAAGQYFTYNPNGGACANGEVLKKTANGWECGTDNSGVSAHSALSGLNADDHTQYVMLAGRAGGQNLRGGTAASNNLSIESTSDATKGFVLLQPNGGNVGIGTNNPLAKLDVAGGIRATEICDENGANCKDISSGWGAGGDIDGITTAAGSALTGGAASGTATLAVQTDAATIGINGSNQLQVQDSAISSAKILDGTIATVDLGNSQVTDAKINTVSVNKITSALGQYLTYNPNGGACANGEVLKKTANGWECGTDNSGVSAHSALSGLNADDHTQYVMLAGRTGGQSLLGGTAASNNLSLESTSDATKGFILLQPNGGNVGVGTTAPSVRLDVEGTIQIGDGGETCSLAANAGMIKYTSGTLQYCNGSSWQTLGVSGSGLTSLNAQTGSTQTFAVNDSGLAPQINSSSNVHTLSIPLASGAGVTSGTISKIDYDNFTAKLSSVSGSTLNSGMLWVGNGSNQATAVSVSGDATLSSTGALTIANNAVTGAKIIDGAVTSAKILDGTIATADIANSAITDAKIDTVSINKITSGLGQYFTYNPNGGACALGEVLKRTVNGWECGTDVGGVTDHGLLGGLNDDDHTQYVMLAGRVGGQNLRGGTAANNNLTLESTTDAAKGSILLQPNGGNVGIGTTSPLRRLSVQGNTIANGSYRIISVNESSAGNESISMGYDANGTIHTAGFLRSNNNLPLSLGTLLTPSAIHVADGGNVGVGTTNPQAKLDVAGAIRATEVCDETGSNCKDISSGWGAGGDIDGITTAAGSALSGGTASGTATLSVQTDATTIEVNGSNQLQIKDLGVGAAKLASNAVTTAKILDANVTTAKIADANVTTAKLADGSVTSAKILDGTIAAGDLASESVTSAKVLDGTIATVDLANSAVTDAKIDTVSVNKMTSGLGQYFTYNPNGGACAIGEVLKRTVNGWECGTDAGGVTDHGLLGGLTDDDHTQYVMLAGRTGGQNLRGGTAANNNLTLESTSNATKGFVLLQPNGGNVGIGTTSPEYILDVIGSAAVGDRLRMARDGAGYSWIGARGLAGEAGGNALGIYSNSTTGVVENIAVQTNGLTRLTIDTNGNLGIGTNSPQAKLDVAGAIRATEVCDETGSNCKDLSSGWGGGGDIDGITTAAGSALTGGTASGTATLAVQTDATTLEVNGSNQLQIKDSGVGSAQLAANAVTTAKILDANVTTAKMADGSVTSAKILDGTIAAGDLAADAVTSAKILDGTIATADLGNSQVTDAKISALSVNKITSALGQYFTYNPNGGACANGEVLKRTVNGWECGVDITGGAPSGAAGGSLAGTYPNPTLASGAVTTTEILDGTIAAIDIASNAVTTVKILDGNVTTAKILDANITTAKLADGSVTSAKILDGTIATADIGNTQVTDAKIATMSVNKLTSAATQYFTYAPNGAACSNGEVLKKTANGWECGTDATGTEADTLATVTARGASTSTPTAFSGTLHANSNLYINNNAPTIYLQDTDHRSGMIHMNANNFYLLSGSANNSTGWTTNGAHWPLMIDLTNDNITLGGSTNVAEGTLSVAGNGVWHAGNFNPASYQTALGYTPLSNTSTSGQSIAYTSAGGPQVLGSGGGASMLSFHRPGSYAVNFGLDTDNVLKVGGWSMGGVAHTIYHSGNFNASTYQTALGYTPVNKAGDSMTGNLSVTGTVTSSGAVNANGGVVVDGNVVIDDGAGWHRTYGSTGWFNGTYSGGWFMSDATWIRSYGGKSVLLDTGVNVTGVNAADGAYAIRGTTSNTGGGGVIGYSQNSAVYGILGHANAYAFYGAGAGYLTGTFNAGGLQVSGNGVWHAGNFNPGTKANLDANSGNLYLGTNGQVNATIIYDTNNTGYYLDPNGTSITNDFRASVFYDINNTAYYMQPHATSMFNDLRANIFYDRQNTGFYMQPSGTSIMNVSYQSFIYDRDNGGYYLDPNGTTSMNVLYAHAHYYHSDARLKHDVRSIEDPLSKILSMKGVRFKWNESEEEDIGFIAQDIQKIAPELVHEKKDPENPNTQGILGVKYGNVVSIVVEAMKEMWAKVTNHDERIEKLESENKELKARLDRLEKMIEQRAPASVKK